MTDFNLHNVLCSIDSIHVYVGFNVVITFNIFTIVQVFDAISDRGGGRGICLL